MPNNPTTMPTPEEPVWDITIDVSALDFALEAVYGSHKANAKIADVIRRSLQAARTSARAEGELEILTAIQDGDKTRRMKYKDGGNEISVIAISMGDIEVMRRELIKKMEVGNDKNN